MLLDRQYLNIKWYEFVFFVIRTIHETLLFDIKYSCKQTHWGWRELQQGREHGHTLTEAGVSLGTRTQRLEWAWLGKGADSMGKRTQRRELGHKHSSADTPHDCLNGMGHTCTRPKLAGAWAEKQSSTNSGLILLMSGELCNSVYWATGTRRAGR